MQIIYYFGRKFIIFVDNLFFWKKIVAVCCFSATEVAKKTFKLFPDDNNSVLNLAASDMESQAYFISIN